MICKECVFYNGRTCLWSNRVRFWFDGYNCKHANDGTSDKMKDAEYVRFSAEFALKVLVNFMKLYKIICEKRL